MLSPLFMLVSKGRSCSGTPPQALRASSPASGGARGCVAALMMGLAVAGCDPPEKSISHNLPVLNADRVKVLNADSLVIDGRHVHLSNASSPLGALHARCWAEALLAASDTDYVRDLVNHAGNIEFKPNGKTDSYDRDLGIVLLDGRDLGEELYQQGKAARLTNPRFDWCQPISQQAEGAPPITAVINLGQ